MRTIPKYIYNNKEISKFLSRRESDNFFSMDEIDQDEFVALCIRALGSDVEIVLDPDGMNSFVQYLMSYKTEPARDVMEFLAKSAREKFSHYFNQLAEEESNNQFISSMRDARKIPYQDQINGETRWI